MIWAFLELIGAGIYRIQDGVYFGEKTVKSAFDKNKGKER